MTEANPDGLQRPGEGLWSFVQRCQTIRCVSTRQRWDKWLAPMPPGERAAIISRLDDKAAEQSLAALSELVVYATLCQLYSSVEVEVDPGTGTGSNTDFAVTDTKHVHFEVHRPTEARDHIDANRRYARMKAQLEKVDSADFYLTINLVALGDAELTMRGVRRRIAAWLNDLDYEDERRRRDDDHARRAARPVPPKLDSGPMERAKFFAIPTGLYQPPEIVITDHGWVIEVMAEPRAQDHRGSGQRTVGTSVIGLIPTKSVEALRHAIQGKVRQHRGLTDDLVVVLDMSGMLMHQSEIIWALYGKPGEHGALWTGAPGERPAAVLVLEEVHPFFEHETTTATLWLPPGRPSPIRTGPWRVATSGHVGWRKAKGLPFGGSLAMLARRARAILCKTVAPNVKAGAITELSSPAMTISELLNR